MSPTIPAAATYFGLVFLLGFALGTLRVTLLEPSLGSATATLIELPFMLAACWPICGWTLRRWSVPRTASARLLMGLLAFALLLSAEALLGVLGFGRSLADQWAATTSPPGMMGLAAQGIFALFPLAHLFIRND